MDWSSLTWPNPLSPVSYPGITFSFSHGSRGITSLSSSGPISDRGLSSVSTVSGSLTNSVISRILRGSVRIRLLQIRPSVLSVTWLLVSAFGVITSTILIDGGGVCSLTFHSEEQVPSFSVSITGSCRTPLTVIRLRVDS